MNFGLHCLLRRILLPHVAIRLAKEELCLSMAAIARLRLLQRDISGLSLDAIATRAQRVSHLCSPTELGMISDGATALFCTRDDLADALVSGMYTTINETKDVLVRFSHLNSVVCYAASIKSYCSETLSTIIMSAPKLLNKSDSELILSSFLNIARQQLCLEEFCTLANELRKVASSEQMKVIDNIHYVSNNDTGDLLPVKKEYSRDLDDDQNNDDYGDDKKRKIIWSAASARSWILQWARQDVKRTQEDILQAMELYAHFGIRDPVLQKKIDSTALSVISVAGSLQRDMFSKIVITFPHLFPRSSELLCKLRNEALTAADDDNTMSRSSGSDSDFSDFLLTRSFRTTQAYERLLVGRRIPEDWMFEVMQEQDGALPVDVAAQAACIFAEKGEILDGIILQLSTQLHKLSPQGVTAFVRAARRDSSGALLPHSAAVFAHFAAKGMREASLETLLQLCAACALPFSRGSDKKEHNETFEGQGSFAEAFITRLLSVMSESSSKIQLLCEIAKSAFAIDTNNELVHFVCSTVCAGKSVENFEDLLALVDMLCSRKYVNEPLLDVIEPVLRQRVILAVSKVENNLELSFQEARQLATFAALQAEFDCPDFEGSLLLLLHALEEHMNCAPIEILPGAGLLLLKHMRCATVEKVLDKLSGNVGKLSDKAVGELAELISQFSDITHRREIVNELVTDVAYRLSLHSDNNFFSPDAVGLSVVAHCRCGEPGNVVIQNNIVEYLLEWMGALCPRVYTELCGVLHMLNKGDLLTNGLVDEFPRRLNMLSTTQISKVVFGLGEANGIGERLSHQLVAEKCSDYVIDYSHEFWSGKDISRMLYGFSRMLCTKRSLYNVFATRLALRPILIPMDQEAISFAVAAFGRSKYLDKKLLDKFSRRILENLNDLKAPDLLLAIRGFSRVLLLNDKLYNELGNKAVEKSNEFPLQAKCVLLTSFGSLGIEHEKLATQMLDGIVEKLPELENANKAVDVIVSLWQMNYNVEDDKRVEKVADWIVKRSGELNGDGISKLCYVLTETNWRHISLLNAIAEQSVQLQIEKNVSAECCRTVLDTLGRFMVHHQGARERLSSLGRSVSKEMIQLSQDEEQQVQLLLKR